MLLRRNGPQPPGNFPFQDERTGMKFPGEGGFEDVASRIIQHRKANPAKYNPESDAQYLHWDFVCKQLDDYTCQRLGNHPNYCYDPNNPNPPQAALPLLAGKVCPKCGANLGINYCSTCTGRRITGYTCQNPKCGNELPP